MDNRLKSFPFQLLDEKKVAEITGRAIQTLRNDRFHGRGIPYIKMSNRQVRYDLKDIISFCEGRKIQTEG